MPASRRRQFAILFSLGLHLAAVAVMASQKLATLVPVDFYGQQRAVTVSATFAPPVTLSEPEPVEIVQSETDAPRSTVEAEPDAELSKQTLDLPPTVPQSELQVELERKTPQAQLAELRQLKKQPQKPRPNVRPIPRQQRPLELAAMAAAEPIPVGTQQETPPTFSHNPPPMYPDEAYRNRWQGEVLLRVTIDSDGHVRDVTLQRSSGYKMLDEAAVAAIRRWKAVPATRGGEPVSVTLLLPVQFNL